MFKIGDVDFFRYRLVLAYMTQHIYLIFLTDCDLVVDLVECYLIW